MACMLCGSENQDLFNAEVVVSFTKLEAVLTNPPAYMIRKPLICLECGFMEVFVRQAQLRELRKGYATLRFPSTSMTVPLQGCKD